MQTLSTNIFILCLRSLRVMRHARWVAWDAISERPKSCHNGRSGIWEYSGEGVPPPLQIARSTEASEFRHDGSADGTSTNASGIWNRTFLKGQTIIFWLRKGIHCDDLIWSNRYPIMEYIIKVIVRICITNIFEQMFKQYDQQISLFWPIRNWFPNIWSSNSRNKYFKHMADECANG